jgi:hypothetical protein
MLEQIYNASGLIAWPWPSEIRESLNSRLYVMSSLIVARLRKPWKSHSSYSATRAGSTEEPREVREALSFSLWMSVRNQSGRPRCRPRSQLLKTIRRAQAVESRLVQPQLALTVPFAAS